MPLKDVKCRACGKVFQADDKLSRAFCLYCGTENYLNPQISHEEVTPYDLAEDPTTRREQLQRLAVGDGPDAALARDRLLFWAARFERVSRREERYGDKFLELITVILFYSQNYPSAHTMKRARRDVEKFFERPDFPPGAGGTPPARASRCCLSSTTPPKSTCDPAATTSTMVRACSKSSSSRRAK